MPNNDDEDDDSRVLCAEADGHGRDCCFCCSQSIVLCTVVSAVSMDNQSLIWKIEIFLSV